MNWHCMYFNLDSERFQFMAAGAVPIGEATLSSQECTATATAAVATTEAVTTEETSENLAAPDPDYGVAAAEAAAETVAENVDMGGGGNAHEEEALMLRYQDHGLVFKCSQQHKSCSQTLLQENDHAHPLLHHLSTFPAFAFVRAVQFDNMFVV